MGNTFYLSFEPGLMEWLQGVLGEGGCNFFSNFSFFGEEIALILILGFLYWGRDKKFGIYIGTNLLIGVVINPLIKNFFLRRRPYFDHPGISCYRPVSPDADLNNIAAQGYSFPSGHSMNGAITYGSLATYTKNKILVILAFVVPFLIGLSRVVVGVHYPTDVLVGWGVGAIIVFAVPALYAKFGEEKRGLLNLIIFLIMCLGIFYCRTEDYFSGLGTLGGFFAAIEFDKRFVNFEETDKISMCIIRIVGGCVVYLVINNVLKMPFSPQFLESGTLAAFMVRTIRYFIDLFVMMGVYPIAFKYMDKLVKNK